MAYNIVNPITALDAQIKEWSDLRVENFPLMGSFLTPLIINAVYCLFVLQLGPALMKNRKALSFHFLILFYNLLQIIVNFFIMLKVSKHWTRVSIWCTPLEFENTSLALDLIDCHYYYMLLKYLDLVETIFFTLRKKKNQVTFLHVFHHLFMASFTWISVKFAPGGPYFYTIFTNTLVHCIMYIYYLSALLSINSLWWKNYITIIQIVHQIFLNIPLFLQAFNADCNYPKYILFGVIVGLNIILFSFFKMYFNLYIKQKNK